MYRLPIYIATIYDYDQYRNTMMLSKKSYSKHRIQNSKRTVFYSGKYRYGFGSQEKDDEISGSGNSYTAKYWQYDPRIVRRWNPDPITYPWQSTYATFNNNPIVFNDPSGLFGSRKEARAYKKDNGLKGRIHKGDDGIFAIDNKKAGTSLFKDPSLDNVPNLIGRQDDGVIKSVLVSAEKPTGSNTGNDIASAIGGATAVGELTRQGKVFEQFGQSAQNVEKALKNGQSVQTGAFRGKSFSQNFRGNQYVSPKSVTNSLSTAKLAKNLGRGLTVVSTAASIYTFANSDQSGADYARLTGAAIITGSAFIPVVGPFISIGLGVADSFGAFDAAYESFDP